MIFQDIQYMDENKAWHSTFQGLNIKARESAGSQKTGKSVENRIYNRYRDVVPYDHSLVRLRDSDTEYINANLVKVSSIDKEYILTQGPLANTCQHFWEMVWEQNTYSVVMLNRVVEKNQLKCHQYWPLSGSLTFGNIKVTVKEEEDFNEFIVRVLELEHLKEEETRTIHHFHYVAWPDFGVPRSPEAFLKYLLQVREFQRSVNGVGPPVIHCSAGIGRSGTFALIDAALTEIIQTDNMMDYDVKKILLEMRTYRPGLIQTTEQLRFSYIAILEGANMVAPSAYSTAYWKIANPGGSEEEGESEEEEPEKPEVPERPKRIAGNDSEVTREEPKAKEPRKEPPLPAASESESDEDEIVNLSDIDTGNNDNDEETKVGLEKGGTTLSDQSAPEVLITVTTASSQSVSEVQEDSDKEETVKSEKIGEGQQDKTEDERSESGVTEKDDSCENVVPSREMKTTTSTTEDSTTTADVNTADSRHEQLEKNDEDVQAKSESTSEINASVASLEAVSSGRFPSSYNMAGVEEDSSGGSMEQVVSRWQSNDVSSMESVSGDGQQPRPRRSAMRTNSTEGKRKSVSFLPENGEAEQGFTEDSTGIERKSMDNNDERETESSKVRQRQIEERKESLSKKVDSIKKNMKKHETSGGDSFSQTVIGLVLCVVVVGVAFLYYRYRS